MEAVYCHDLRDFRQHRKSTFFACFCPVQKTTLHTLFLYRGSRKVKSRSPIPIFRSSLSSKPAKCELTNERTIDGLADFTAGCSVAMCLQARRMSLPFSECRPVIASKHSRATLQYTLFSELYLAGSPCAITNASAT